MVWTDNAAMWWHNGSTYVKVTDHNRTPISISVERIEKKDRMVDGTLRRYSVSKKRSFSCGWDMLPSTNSKATGLKTVDGGMAAEDIEAFHNTTNGAFNMQLRRGDGTIETVLVMITDFSKDVPKRGIVDFWNVTITLEEV